MKSYAIVGCGGIGFALAPILARLLMATDSTLYLVDGKAVKQSNVTRQFGASAVGKNKAEVLERIVTDIQPESTRLRVAAVPCYLENDTKDMHGWLNDPDLTVFLCVDTAASRIAIEDIISTRKDYTLVSGGNAEFDGQAIFSQKVKNKVKFRLPSEIDPDLRTRSDGRTPSMIPCDEAQVSEPQLVLANVQAALCMLSLWYNHTIGTDKKAKKINFAAFDVRRPEVFPSWRGFPGEKNEQ